MPRRLLQLFTGLLLYGISDEIHQSFTPGRTPDWRDALADMIGGLAGALIFAAVTARPRKRTTGKP